MKILEAIHARGTHNIVAIVTKFLHRKLRYLEKIIFSFDSQNKLKDTVCLLQRMK